MTKNLRFYNKSGELTRYGLVCGYVEKFEAMGQALELWFEGGTFHVRHFSHVSRKLVAWENFEKLTEARKFYYKCRKHIKSLTTIELAGSQPK
jgi:hypothetical protein